MKPVTTPSTDPKDLARMLRYQQGLLKLAAQCQQPDAVPKKVRSEPSRRLGQLVRRVRAQSA